MFEGIIYLRIWFF